MPTAGVFPIKHYFAGVCRQQVKRWFHLAVQGVAAVVDLLKDNIGEASDLRGNCEQADAKFMRFVGRF